MVIDPDYSAFIVRARIIAKQEGYALAIHGSTTRDLDLIAVPWTKEARTPQALTARIDFNTGWRRQRADGTRCEIGERVEPTVREHGRLVWTFMPEGFADPRFVDFSVIPPCIPLLKQRAWIVWLKGDEMVGIRTGEDDTKWLADGWRKARVREDINLPNVQAVPAAAGGSESTQEPSPPLGTSI